MFLFIKDTYSFLYLDLNKISLPYLYKGIEIIKENDFYYFSLKHGYYFIEHDKIRKIEYKKYLIKQRDFFNDIEIYVYKDNKGISDYHLYNNETFVYLASDKANIVNKDEYLKDYYLIYKDGLLKTNSNFLLCNGKSYNGERLKNNDEVRFYNLHFIYYDNFLYMNNFLLENKLKIKKLNETFIKYENIKMPIRNSYLPLKKELLIEELPEFNEIKQNKSRSLVYQIGQSLTMTLAMFILAFLNVYKNYSGVVSEVLAYILMPFTMLISGIVWPILIRKGENRKALEEVKENRDKYLKCLLDYKLKLNDNINEYLKDENIYYFNGEIDEDKLFYITDRSLEFLKISIGYITLSKEIKTKDVNDEDVKENISLIKYRLNNIENCPYFLDLKKYKTISFVIFKNEKVNLIKRFMLELSSKYHFEDFYLAIYSENLDLFSDFFGLPQLIFNNNRLTLNKKRELQDLNNLKLDKPLILLASDKIDFVFTNKEIHLLYFVSSLDNIYKNSDVLVEYKDNNEGFIYGETKIAFKYDDLNIDYKKYASILGNYQKVKFLNKVITFKDIYKDFDINSFYTEKQSGLRADFALIGKELLAFDLHESKSGPHGLIGGSTGSGKSELIVSMLLSLCIRYRPDYLNIILIDYKGGGIKESLSYKNMAIPHIVASIDNLDNDVLKRLVVAIDFECKRRQSLFKKLSNKAMVSIMNIDDYLNNDYQNFDLPKIAHLLIVVDEFAEMKKENPDIIKSLVSFSRIGRSLGLHLILATQRPNGIIDDEIWSNSRFKIALKVLSEKDSNDIIKTNKAAYLSNPGEFYLRVDENVLFSKSIYAKKDIDNNEPYEVSLLDNRLNVLSKNVLKKKTTMTEAIYIVGKIIKTCENLMIKTNNIKFKKPNNQTIADLKKKYQEDGLVLGEIDDYLRAYNGLLKVSDNENILIYSSRLNEINNILNNVKKQMVVIGSKRYQNAYISDSILYEEVDDIDYLFKKLIKDDTEICLVVEDVSCLFSYDEAYVNEMCKLIKRNSIFSKNIIALSRQSNLNFKFINSFKYKFVIDMQDRQDLLNIFSSHSEHVGKSFFYDDKLIGFVPCIIEELKSEKSFLISYLDKIPDKIAYLKNDNKVLIGYDTLKRKPIYLKDDENVLLCSYDLDIVEKYKEIFKDCLNIRAELYDKSLSKEEYNHYLWFGDGLYSQRLFYVESKEELKDGYAYYLRGNRGLFIKAVAYE